MSPRRTHSLMPRCAGVLPWLLAAILTLTTLFAPVDLALAQASTPQPTAAVTAGAQTPTGIPGTPTPTPTPTLTPTATPTLTEIQSRLTLAQTYLDGKDYDQAALLFAAVAEEQRGNPEALAGLKTALDGRALFMATMVAPPPTAAPTETSAPAPAPTLGDAVSARLREFLGTAFAALALVVLVYLLANLFRWLLCWLRELWYTRGLPLLRRPAVEPGFLIGEFLNGLGDAGANVPAIVTQSLAEKLLAWNQLVQAKEVPIEPAPTLDLGGMGWLKILWSWILPPPRGYKITGGLFQSPTGAYQLAVQRVDQARNRVDLSTTLDKRGASPEAAFRALAGEAAKWLVSPADMAASQAVVRGMRSVRGAGEEALALTPSEIFDQALELLLPVRQQVNQGAIDFNDARKQLRDAEGLLRQLPDGSQLRHDLQGVIADLRRAVPGG